MKRGVVDLNLPGRVLTASQDYDSMSKTLI